MKVEWKRGPDFAEIAEALGVNTDAIMAAKVESDGFGVLFTYEATSEHPVIYSALLKRDRDGVLVVFGQPTARPEMWEQITAEMNTAIEQNMARRCKPRRCKLCLEPTNRPNPACAVHPTRP